MPDILHEDQTFHQLNFSEQEISGNEYLRCTFSHCDFSKSDLSGNDFVECTFEHCNLTMVKLNDTGLKDVRFFDCKVMGVDFHPCSKFMFAIEFRKCQVDYSSFFQRKMKKCRFTDCSLRESDFTETDLTEAVFHQCDLHLAAFDRTILDKADLRTASDYTIDPAINRIKKARFAYPGVLGLLRSYDIRID